MPDLDIGEAFLDGNIITNGSEYPLAVAYC